MKINKNLDLSFKIDSIVWKLIRVGTELYSRPCFKIDSIVWKSHELYFHLHDLECFKIDSIVWKLILISLETALILAL